MIGMIAKNTNIYSVQQSQHKVNVNTTYDEMSSFIGILLFMGQTQFPSYRMYWQPDTRLPLIADAMPRNRFEDLKRYFHVVDNNDTPADVPGVPKDHFFKVRPLLESFKKQCQKLEPEERHSIDEQITPFKGASRLKQYVPKKPKKWGFKIFARCGSSGIIYDFMDFQVAPPPLEGHNHYGLGGNVVLHLTKPLFGPYGYKVYFDNFFTSLELMQELIKQGVLALGTVQQGRLRGCPVTPDMELKKAGRGSVSCLTDGHSGIAVVKWFDNKPVLLASNYVGADPMGEIDRWDSKQGQRVTIPCPQVIKEYNGYMGGVDVSDMLMSLYRINHRSKKFYMRVVFWCFGSAATNAWNLYRRHCWQLEVPVAEIMSLAEFIKDLAKSLIKKETGKKLPEMKKRGRPRVCADGPTDADASDEASTSQENPRKKPAPQPLSEYRFDKMSHWPVVKVEDGETVRQRCNVCAERKVNSRTFMKCDKCDVYLCITKPKNCFKQFHKVTVNTQE